MNLNKYKKNVNKKYKNVNKLKKQCGKLVEKNRVLKFINKFSTGK